MRIEKKVAQHKAAETAISLHYRSCCNHYGTTWRATPFDYQGVSDLE